MTNGKEENGTVEMTEAQKALVLEYMAKLAMVGLNFLIDNVSKQVDPRDCTEAIIAGSACILVDTMLAENLSKERRTKRFANVIKAMQGRFLNGLQDS